MKRVVLIVLVLTTLFLSCSCDSKNDKDPWNEYGTYTVSYSDDAGLHTITVAKGDAYSLDVLPQKTGYDFIGLFDAETGGTQYVNASGNSLSTFNENRNLVLFPQFKPKEYTLILDYQGAAVTGSRSLSVNYDSTIRELPMNLTLENKVFTGWYTEPDGEGTQIADQYGVLPASGKVTERIFDLSDKDGRLYLYAGFEWVKYTVTFYFEDNNAPEEMKVAYGTNIADVVPTTRVNGQAVLVWSKTKNDTARENLFAGKVTDDLILYAVEYAPVIDFDPNGGKDVIPVVAKAGTAISLPTPTRKGYKFVEWQDLNGQKYTATTMPTKGLTLKAVWQAMLVFDENGGSDVNDISVPAGQTITLPIPEKDGFLFAGWYTADKEQYTSTRMPAASVELKAGWHSVKKETIIVYNATAEKFWAWSNQNKPSAKNGCFEIDLSRLHNGKATQIKIEFHMAIEAGSSHPQVTLCADFYSQKQVSSVYFLKTTNIGTCTNSSYSTVNFTESFYTDGNIFVMFYLTKDYNIYVQDFYYTIIYPDTTNLYL